MTEQKPIPASIWSRVVATFFGLGYSPVAPGTAGSAGAVVLYLALSRLHPVAYLVVAAIVFGVGLRAASEVQRAAGAPDPGLIVIDEVAGYLVTMFLVPHTAGYIIAGFFIFRLMDIVKPYPASRFDRQAQTGFTIMIDDVIAGVYANLALQLLRLVLE